MQWAARTALAVMVAAALLPTVIRAATAYSEDPITRAMVICTSTAPAPAPSDGDDKVMVDCPLCTLQAHSTVPMTASPDVLLIQHLGQAVPTLFLQAPRLLFAWAPAQSRAPPVRA